MLIVSRGAYRPGACNIGTAEIARRRRTARLLLAFSALLAAGLIGAGAPVPARAGLFLPLAAGIITELEARRRFCVAFAAFGMRNFGDRSQIERVDDPDARGADRLAAVRMIAEGAVLAFGVTIAFLLLP